MDKWINSLTTFYSKSWDILDIPETSRRKSHTESLKWQTISILFMILDRGGNILLRHTFSNDFNNNEHLIASFLMAMNIFASETFTYSSQLTEIKFNNYTISPLIKRCTLYIYFSGKIE